MKTDALFPRLPAVIIFFVVIALPLADGILHFKPDMPLPNRKDTEQNKGQATDSLSLLFQKREAQFQQNLFFRNFMIRTYNSYKYLCFKKSGVPKVIIGRKGWLFQARKNEEPGTAGYYPSLRPFTFKELDEWRQALQKRQRWLQARGMEYLFIPVPDKSSIYPEYLPENLRHFYGHSRLQQLVEHLKKNNSVKVLDIRSALQEAKKGSELYARTDSHWNELGACTVSGEIHNYLANYFKSAERFRLSDYNFFTSRKRSGGNLAMMLSLENSFFREERMRVFRHFSSQAKKARLPALHFSRTVAPEAFENKTAPFQNAVMFHDSFGRKLKPYLAEFFSRIVFVRDWGFHFNREVIAKEKPAIVLDEIAEHFLYNIKLADDWIERDGI